jgi:hypothetical protein
VRDRGSVTIQMDGISAWENTPGSSGSPPQRELRAAASVLTLPAKIIGIRCRSGHTLPQCKRDSSITVRKCPTSWVAYLASGSAAPTLSRPLSVAALWSLIPQKCPKRIRRSSIPRTPSGTTTFRSTFFACAAPSRDPPAAPLGVRTAATKSPTLWSQA